MKKSRLTLNVALDLYSWLAELIVALIYLVASFSAPSLLVLCYLEEPVSWMDLNTQWKLTGFFFGTVLLLTVIRIHVIGHDLKVIKQRLKREPFDLTGN